MCRRVLSRDALLLTAQIMGKPVIITIENCFAEYPKIIAVAIQN